MPALEPVKMCRIRIVGPKRAQQKAIEILHAEKVLHIEDFKPGKYNIGEFYFDTGNPLKTASKYSELIIRVRSLISNLKIKKSDFEILENLPKEPQKVLQKIEISAANLLEKLKSAEAEKKDLEKFDEPLAFVSALNIKPAQLKPLENVEIFRGYYEGDFEKELVKITKKYQLKSGVLNKRQLFALFVGKDFSEKVREVLNSHNYAEVQMPSEFAYNSVEELAKARAVLDGQETKLNEQLNKLREAQGQFLVNYERHLARENEKAEAPLSFGQTENVFIAEGYVPVARYEAVQQKLVKALGKKVYTERSDEEIEFAPTMLDHGRIVSPFEFFLNLYSLPFYKELDPTFLIFIAFPLFFGFMLGDVGYGLVTALLFAAVRVKTKSNVLKGLMNAMIIASIASIAFGFVFGEFFGGEYFGLHAIISREHDINFLILVTLLVGIIHVNLGLALGFINAKRSHGLSHAVFEKLSWVVLEIGGLLMLFKLYDFFYASLPQQLYVGLGIVIVGLLMLLKGHGIYGLIEVPSLASNILSYTRLFALGLASVALAVIVNEFTTEFVKQGGIMILPGILILVAGHVLNISIGIIGGFLQALRLHYVEFFTKFYKGGGKRYNPFGG